MHRTLLLILAVVGLLSACQDDLPGWLAVEGGEVHGPSIVYDAYAKPLPEVPFPNDSSLRVTDETASGLQINVSTARPTEHQRNLRHRLNQLDGFGVSGAAWLRFDGPLDLTTVTDDSVMIVNIEPGHPREGERIPLDLGRGYLPQDTAEEAYHGMDPHEGAWSILFPADNVADLDGDGVDEPLTHYERSTNTLILQPLLPLAPAAKHAVIITRDVKGWVDGAAEAAPVRSPFDYKLHLAHSFDVPRALELADVPVNRLAFAWTYTTRDVMAPMQALREGVYGRGPLARMAELAPAKIKEVRDPTIDHDIPVPDGPNGRDNPYIVQASFLSELMALIGGIQGGGAELFDFSHVDYMVFGSYASPDLRVSDRRDIELNPFTGEGDMAPAEVPFVLSVPKVSEKYAPPFPVLIYFHGTGTSRMESLAVADEMARQGFATIAFDSVGHGPLIPDIPFLLEQNPDDAGLFALLPVVLADILAPDRADEVAELPFLEALDVLYENGLFAELAVHGRNEDENGNGHLEAAEAFYFADPFRMCASFHQDLVDFLVLVRMLRELDPAAVPSEPLANPATADYETLKPYMLAGDFNADGVLDIGGPTVALGTSGTSLGGIHAIMAAAIEPEVKTTTPIVAGGGLTAVLTRSTLRMVIEPVLLDALGTVIVGCPDEDGTLVLTQGNDAKECRPSRLEEAGFGRVTAGPGSQVTLTNLANGVTKVGLVNEAGGFSLAVETDKGDPLRVSVAPVGGGGAELLEFEVDAKWEGAGYARSSPDFRRAVGVMQHALDQCDPLSFASALFTNPPPGHEPTNVLMLSAVGDRTVPNASSVSLAAAVGLLGTDQQDTLTRWEALRDAGLVQSKRVDVDDIRRDNPPDMPSVGAARPVWTGTGHSSIRFADADGNHTYIAGEVKDGFDWGTYHRQVMALYHRCGGRVVPDLDPDCLAKASCPILDDVGSIPGCLPPGEL